MVWQRTHALERGMAGWKAGALDKVQADSATIDRITKLQTDLATVCKAHEQLAAAITPARLAATRGTVKKLQNPR